MKQFFRDRDGLGQTPNMTYKQSETYGTTLGGCVSCCATIVIQLYIIVVLGSLIIMEKNYGQTTVDLLLPLADTPIYTLSPLDIVPAYQVYSTSNGQSSYNDESTWTIQFFKESTKVDESDPSGYTTELLPVDSILCSEYI